MTHRRLAILGSTGSIGTRTLQVVSQHPDKFSITLLVAGTNHELFINQINSFSPKYVFLSDPTARLILKRNICGALPKVLDSEAEVDEILRSDELDLVVAAIVGMAGLSGVLSSLESGKVIALANKESLVAAGELVRTAANSGGGSVIPIDSEHSAIFQTLQGEKRESLNSIVLTASGGPFLNLPKEKFEEVSVAQALNHPRWKMGGKVTIDSATMMNKALELIEAAWLFELDPNRIEVVIHPQSIIHSMIRLIDGSLMAQLSVPDMGGPIAYALNFPGPRLSKIMDPLDLIQAEKLEFFELDTEKFPGVQLAKLCLAAGGAMPAVFNIANEIAVELFLRGEIRFNYINKIVEKGLNLFAGKKYSSLEELLDLEREIKGVRWFQF